MAYNPEIFRAYDIRGVYKRDFDNDFSFKLGAALVAYFKPGDKPLLIGHDDRDFSVDLAQALIDGINAAGGKVEYLGLATTPFFNFVYHHLGVSCGVVVTASHNAAEYGGFKIFGGYGNPIGLDSGLGQIRLLVDQIDIPVSSEEKNHVSNRLKLMEKYIRFIVKKSKVKPKEIKDLRVKISGCEAAMEEVRMLSAKCPIEIFYEDYDISFSFDEDADRLLLFDRLEKPINTDYVTGLLVKDAVRFLSKPKVVYDLRFSKGVINKFTEWGIKGYRSKVGRVYVRKIMVETKSDIAGEVSGHVYFKEDNYHELPLLGMLKILRILARSRRPINELIEPFRTWFNSGEISAISADQDFEKFKDLIKQKYADGKIEELDGIGVEYENWWFNIRQSHTEPVWRMIVEAKEKNLLDEKVAELKALIG